MFFVFTTSQAMPKGQSRIAFDHLEMRALFTHNKDHIYFLLVLSKDTG